MDKRMNAGYEIINSITVGKSEIVLGYNENASSKYVTWQCTNGDNYFWGHYIDDKLKAQRDFLERGLKEIEIAERVHKPKNKDMER